MQMMSLFDFLIKTDPKSLVRVFDSHNHVLIFYYFLDNWLYADVLAAKEWKVEYWKRNQIKDEVSVYVTPIKGEK